MITGETTTVIGVGIGTRRGIITVTKVTKVTGIGKMRRRKSSKGSIGVINANLITRVTTGQNPNIIITVASRTVTGTERRLIQRQIKRRCYV